MSMLAGYGTFLGIVQSTFLYAAVGVTAICAFDWAVRTRRINPFNRVARFFRSNIDPMMAPVERVIVRRGGLPAQAPWWTLAFVVIGGILTITLLQMLGGVLQQVVFGLAEPRRLPWIVVLWVFSFLRMALLVRVLSSYFVSPYSKWVRWSYVTTEWMIAPLQRIIPRIGMFDISPIVAWLLLNLIESFVTTTFIG
jgi:YggT family protein